MTLTRRGFLASLAAGAAALGLPETVAKAETGPETWLLKQANDGTYAVIDAFTGQVFTGAPTRDMLDALSDPSLGSRRPFTFDDLDSIPLTFAAMQVMCSAQGHRLRLEADGWTEHYMAIDGGYQWSYFEHWDEDHQGVGPVQRLDRIDSWRRSLHADGA